MSGERAKGLARSIGVAEHAIDDTSEVSGLMSSSMVGFPDFQMLYFKIFSRIQPEFQTQHNLNELQETDYDLLKSDRDESSLLPEKHKD